MAHLTINDVPICGAVGASGEVSVPFSFDAGTAWISYWDYATKTYASGPVIWIRELAEWRINGHLVDLDGTERFVNVKA